MRWERALIWFRNDLRIHDHEPLHTAIRNVREVIPVYCVDPRHFEETSFGFLKTAAFRAQFLRESLEDLRAQLRALGSDLIIRWGKPEELLPELAEEYGAAGVFAHQEVTDEELKVEDAVEKALFSRNITLELSWGATLYHLEDLPMPIGSLPEVFTQFRKQVEKMADVRPQFPTPAQIDSPEFDDPGELPSWKQMGLEPPVKDTRSVLQFQGGESAGLQRLHQYFWEQDLLREYKEARNGLLGADYSSKFSVWLAMGCLSPRRIYDEVQRYEAQVVRNKSTYWLIFELIWRDYFRFVAKKHGNTLFRIEGIRQDGWKGTVDWGLFEKWKEGKTGIPFVDANMLEIKNSGFMSNRGRQNVASFLVNDLGLDWRMGAEYFESQLIDYDPCSNWGNWNYVAGVGNDPREGRYFNVISQAKRYDSQGEYVKHWLPVLTRVPHTLVHELFEASPKQLETYGVILGEGYPRPVVSLRGKAAAKR